MVCGRAVRTSLRLRGSEEAFECVEADKEKSASKSSSETPSGSAGAEVKVGGGRLPGRRGVRFMTMAALSE